MRRPSTRLSRLGPDATRVASFNPFVSLYWLVAGKTVGGLELYPEKNRLTREEALRLYTQGSSWFSTEDGAKGELRAGQLADFSVLTKDFFTIPAEDIEELKGLGVAAVFTPGAPAEAAIEFIRSSVRA